MTKDILTKLKCKHAYTEHVIAPPDGYPLAEMKLAPGKERAAFVYLFVESQKQFDLYIQSAMEKRKAGGLFWISYRKSKEKTNTTSIATAYGT